MSVIQDDLTQEVSFNTPDLKKWPLGERIGQGAFGDAFLVTDPKSKKKYVLKRVRMARQNEWQRAATKQEIKLGCMLQHPFIVQFIKSWIRDGHEVNIVYGYCEQGDLQTAMKKQKGKHIEERQLRRWLAELLLALHYMQSKHVLHRDLKSSNIFLTAENDVQIGDFGLATLRDLEHANNHDQSIVGTPHFMSPELLNRKKYDYKTDVWSLGCVIYELAALRPAFNAFNLTGLISKICKSTVSQLPSVYSEDFGNLIKWMLKKESSKRPSVDELLVSSSLSEELNWACQRAQQLSPGIELPPLSSLGRLTRAPSSASARDDDGDAADADSAGMCTPPPPAARAAAKDGSGAGFGSGVQVQPLGGAISGNGAVPSASEVADGTHDAGQSQRVAHVYAAAATSGEAAADATTVGDAAAADTSSERAREPAAAGTKRPRRNSLMAAASAGTRGASQATTAAAAVAPKPAVSVAARRPVAARRASAVSTTAVTATSKEAPTLSVEQGEQVNATPEVVTAKAEKTAASKDETVTAGTDQAALDSLAASAEAATSSRTDLSAAAAAAAGHHQAASADAGRPASPAAKRHVKSPPLLAWRPATLSSRRPINGTLDKKAGPAAGRAVPRRLSVVSATQQAAASAAGQATVPSAAGQPRLRSAPSATAGPYHRGVGSSRLQSAAVGGPAAVPIPRRRTADAPARPPMSRALSTSSSGNSVRPTAAKKRAAGATEAATAAGTAVSGLAAKPPGSVNSLGQRDDVPANASMQRSQSQAQELVSAQLAPEAMGRTWPGVQVAGRAAPAATLPAGAPAAAAPLAIQAANAFIGEQSLFDNQLFQSPRDSYCRGSASGNTSACTSATKPSDNKPAFRLWDANACASSFADLALGGEFHPASGACVVSVAEGQRTTAAAAGAALDTDVLPPHLAGPELPARAAMPTMAADSDSPAAPPAGMVVFGGFDTGMAMQDAQQSQGNPTPTLPTMNEAHETSAATPMGTDPMSVSVASPADLTSVRRTLDMALFDSTPDSQAAKQSKPPLGNDYCSPGHAPHSLSKWIGLTAPAASSEQAGSGAPHGPDANGTSPFLRPRASSAMSLCSPALDVRSAGMPLPQQRSADGRPQGCSSNAAAQQLLTLQRVVGLAAQLHASRRWHELGNVLSSVQLGPEHVFLPSAEGSSEAHVVGAASTPKGAFKVGDMVIVDSKKSCKKGTIRYSGPCHWAPGEFVGLELDRPEGKHNGTIEDIVYFRCPPMHGIFVKASVLKPGQK